MKKPNSTPKVKPDDDLDDLIDDIAGATGGSSVSYQQKQ